MDVNVLPSIKKGSLLYFQLIKITWCRIGFHGNHNHINDVTSGRRLVDSNH